MNKKTFSISVDVEDFFLKKNVSDTYFGKKNNEYLGIPQIIDIVNGFNGKVTFFVDVENVENIVSQKTIKEACLFILKSGHELGLHTHPPKLSYGKYKGRVLCNYDCDFQYNFIIGGAKKIESWTGYWPKTHRAGSYGANKDTYTALKKAGIYIDSSVFWEKRDFSFIQENHLNINPFIYNGIKILPVTTFNLQINKLFKNIIINKKTDLEWCNEGELKTFITEKQPNHVDLFLHSNSLINLKRGTRHKYNVDKFIKMIKLLKKFYKPVYIKNIKTSQYNKHLKPTIHYGLNKYSLNDLNEIFLKKLY